MKRVASHSVYLPDGGYLYRMVLELEQGVVTGIYPLDGELENTSWLPGIIILPLAPEAAWRFLPPGQFVRSESSKTHPEALMQQALGRRAAYCADFDFSCWQAVGGTQHIQWL